MGLLSDYLKSHFNLNKEQVTAFLKLGKPFSVEKGHYLLKPRQTSNRAFFIETGIVREFERLPNKEKTTWILGEDNFLYNMPSYYTQDPADCYLQALADATGYYFLQTDLEHLVEESHLWALVRVKIYREYILRLIYRNELHRISKVEDKLAFFEKNQPDIQNKIKQEHIASYINTSMSQLSRVRGTRT